MKWLKKLFSKLFGCKCGCQEKKPCACELDLSKVNIDTITINGKKVKVTTKKEELRKASSKKDEPQKTTSKPKKKVTKKTNKKAKK